MRFSIVWTILCLSAAQLLLAQNTPAPTVPPGGEPLRFAIFSDRTGGGRAGILENAALRANDLAPEFVIGIGDLIEGGVGDKAHVLEEWAGVDAALKGLSVPFYPVPGNHDTAELAEREVWKERYGAFYRHFVHKGVLFLLMCSEDGGFGRISKEQVLYFRDVLSEHPSPQWTFVFIHQPAWRIHRNSGWREIENLLKDRPHTVFCGHTHVYEKNTLHGCDYITLATTGGSCMDSKYSAAPRAADGKVYLGPPRGAEFGEFDHITWVTLSGRENASPGIINMDLKGLYGKDIRTAELSLVKADMSGSVEAWHEPVFYRGDFKSASTKVYVENKSPLALTIEASSEEHISFKSEPSDLKFGLTPGGIKTLPAILTSTDSQNSAAGTLRFRIHMAEGRDRDTFVDYCIKAAPALLQKVRKTPVPVCVDGDLSEWNPAQNQFFEVKPAADPEVRSFRFSTTFDDRFVYMAVEVKDPDIHPVSGRPEETVAPLFHDFQGDIFKQDALEIRFGAASEPIRSRDNGWKWFKDHLMIGFFPPTDSFSEILMLQQKIPVTIQHAFRRSKEGYRAEIAVPVEYLQKLQGGKWEAFRINIIVHDLKETGDFTKTSWMPDWRSPENIFGSGTFQKE